MNLRDLFFIFQVSSAYAAPLGVQVFGQGWA